MEHAEAIRQFIVDEFVPDVRPDELDAGYDLVAGGVVDSLGLLRVITWLEEAFGLSLVDADYQADDLASVAAISALVERAERGLGAGVGGKRP